METFLSIIDKDKIYLKPSIYEIPQQIRDLA